MDPAVRDEITDTVRDCHIGRDDVEIDLSVREEHPGEFYVMPLSVFRTEDIRAWLEETA